MSGDLLRSILEYSGITNQRTGRSDFQQSFYNLLEYPHFYNAKTNSNEAKCVTYLKLR